MSSHYRDETEDSEQSVTEEFDYNAQAEEKVEKKPKPVPSPRRGKARKHRKLEKLEDSDELDIDDIQDEPEEMQEEKETKEEGNNETSEEDPFKLGSLRLRKKKVTTPVQAVAKESPVKEESIKQEINNAPVTVSSLTNTMNLEKSNELFNSGSFGVSIKDSFQPQNRNVVYNSPRITSSSKERNSPVNEMYEAKIRKISMLKTEIASVVVEALQMYYDNFMIRTKEEFKIKARDFTNFFADKELEFGTSQIDEKIRQSIKAHIDKKMNSQRFD